VSTTGIRAGSAALASDASALVVEATELRNVRRFMA
jgi:hypothetical protein